MAVTLAAPWRHFLTFTALLRFAVDQYNLEASSAGLPRLIAHDGPDQPYLAEPGWVVWPVPDNGVNAVKVMFLQRDSTDTFNTYSVSLSHPPELSPADASHLVPMLRQMIEQIQEIPHPQ